jgi:RND superfamily putative drug exporter
MTIGATVFRWRWLIVAAWVAAAGLLLWLVPPVDPARSEAQLFLPEGAPYRRAVAAMRQAFPQQTRLSEATVLFERRGGPLSADDLKTVERVAERIRAEVKVERAGQARRGALRVLSPAAFAIPANPLTGEPVARNPMRSAVTDRGEAAIVIVGVPANFVTVRSKRVVAGIRSILDETALPDGLRVAVTGSSGYGHDYAEAANRSHSRAMYVTLSAVILILLVVYRAPGAAMIPLAAISLAAVVVLKLLSIGELYGMHAGTAERIFVFVLMYGAGIDYSLLLISRYRECTGRLLGARRAASHALNASFAAILASAATDAIGLLMLVFADFGIFRTTGPAVAMALGVAMLASLTLVPAMMGIFGPRQFWPAVPGRRKRRGLIWPRIARAVTARPAPVLIVTFVVLGVPAVRGSSLTWVYHTLAGVDPNYDQKVGNAARGVEMARRHWPVGEIAPTTVLVRSDRPMPAGQWQEVSGRLTGALAATDGVGSVRSLTRPLGAAAEGRSDSLLRPLWDAQIRRHYLSADGRAARFVVSLDHPPLSLEAMAAVERVQAAVARQTRAAGWNMEAYYVGATTEMMDVRAITKADFHRVAPLVLSVILVIVLILLRDVVLSLFMVAATVLSYLATLGIAYWVLTGPAGMQGLDWKVEIFLFVVMVAVGVDYSIFLAARLSQEAKTLPPRQAVEQAVVHTGPVISSCGIIMAATLGSLMAGELTLLRQLGFALALGMLIDTFVVRPVLLPAFATLTRRKGRSVALAASED